jgi:hypothetical protein
MNTMRMGNKDAGELYDNFTEEVNKPEPKKSVLKSLWDGIQRALPTIKTIASVTAKIAPLFV